MSCSFSRRMAVDPELIAQASWYVEDAFSGITRPHPAPFPTARRLHTIYAELHYVRGLATVGLLGLSFVEVPAWCSGPSTAPCGDPSAAATPVMFGLPLLSRAQGDVVEVLCLVVLLGNSVLRSAYLRGNFTRRRDNVAVLALQLAAMVNLILTLVAPVHSTRAMQVYLRGAVAAVKNRSIRRTARKIWLVLREVHHVLTLLIVYVAFFAWVATILFRQSTEGCVEYLLRHSHRIVGSLYMPTIYDAGWNLFVLLTTANFPDVFMPAYTERRASILFFAVFVVFGLFFLLNVLLAVIYQTFSSHVVAYKRARAATRLLKLQRAFELLVIVPKAQVAQSFSPTKGPHRRFDEWQSRSNASIPLDTSLALFAQLNAYKNIRYIKQCKMRLLFDILDTDGDERLSWPEFAQICAVLDKALTTRPRPLPEIQNWWPIVYYSSGFTALSHIVRHPRFDAAVDVLLVLNALVIVCESLPVLRGRPVVIETEMSLWEHVECVFSGLYLLELVLKVLVEGRAAYWASIKNRFDAVVTVSVVAIDIYALWSANAASRVLVQILLVTRCLRLFRLIFSVQRYRIFCMTWLRLLPFGKHVVVFLSAFMYFFAALGMHLFGGLISQERLQTTCPDSPFTRSHYAPNNFNDMASGCVLLFELLIVNNWSALADGFVCVTSKYARWFFVSYYVGGVTILLNLVVASTLDAFVGEYEAEHTNQTHLSGSDGASETSGVMEPA
ncbi:Two-pore ion channel [Achlya hypogyna]|uniref:Two-pore ion channel n=1 Tax=Achlya hypogyna TaxID=1202772 RepID=A0A1V9YH00_ACHHY|nr:Two-pore ion channel [Achlya hypogyna]